MQYLYQLLELNALLQPHSTMAVFREYSLCILFCERQLRGGNVFPLFCIFIITIEQDVVLFRIMH